MKTTSIKNLVAATLLILAATTAQARSWRINNDATKAPDFTDINAAMASEDVVAGDTLYLDEGTNLTTEQNVTKKVTIVGPGYEATLPYGMATISGMLNLKAAEIKVEGMNITGGTKIQADYVTIERCKTYYIGCSGTCRYATIRQCYVVRTNGDSAIGGLGKTDAKSAYWTVENCIISSSVGNYARCITNLYSVVIRNNLLLINASYSSWNLLNLGNADITNNIIVNTDVNRCISDIDGKFINNVVGQNYAAETNHVTGSTSTADVFTGDYESYALIEDSPAKDYGTDGKDCGIFGGLYPYVKGGLPQGHPYYTKAVISSRAENDKVNVSLKIKMQNE